MTTTRVTAQAAISKALNAVGLRERRDYTIQYAMAGGLVTHLYLTVHKHACPTVRKYAGMIHRITLDLGQPWQIRDVMRHGYRHLEADNRAEAADTLSVGGPDHV